MRKIALLLASVATAMLLAGGVALAALSDLSEPASPGANGRVSDILVSGNTIYLAGSFSQITDKDGNTFARNNLAAIDANTGAVTPWNPDAQNSSGNSSVHTMTLSSMAHGCSWAGPSLAWGSYPQPPGGRGPVTGASTRGGVQGPPTWCVRWPSRVTASTSAGTSPRSRELASTWLR